MNCSLPGSSVHGIFHANILELVATSYSRGYSWPRDRTCSFCIGRWTLDHLPTGKPWSMKSPKMQRSLHLRSIILAPLKAIISVFPIHYLVPVGTSWTLFELEKIIFWLLNRDNLKLIAWLPLGNCNWGTYLQIKNQLMNTNCLESI